MSDMAQDLRYLGAQIEETNSNVRLILEILMPMREELAELKEVVNDLPEIKADIRTIKYVLKHMNRQLIDHEHRITKLESKVA